MLCANATTAPLSRVVFSNSRSAFAPHPDKAYIDACACRQTTSDKAGLPNRSACRERASPNGRHEHMGVMKNQLAADSAGIHLANPEWSSHAAFVPVPAEIQLSNILLHAEEAGYGCAIRATNPARNWNRFCTIASASLTTASGSVWSACPTARKNSPSLSSSVVFIYGEASVDGTSFED